MKVSVLEINYDSFRDIVGDDEDSNAKAIRKIFLTLVLEEGQLTRKEQSLMW